tara:strand:+ start:2427 stop:3122 length:696 start_codon:yes stop_codon:yes gene_type:complete
MQASFWIISFSSYYGFFIVKKLVLAIICLFLISPSSSFGEKLGKKKIDNFKTVPKAEKDFNSHNTIFGGVGRMFTQLQIGLDLLVLSYPHYSAFRNRLNLKNYLFWGEWWYKDNWGLKGFYSNQSYKMFGPSGNRPVSKTNHLGILAKTQHALSESWKISAGLGLSKTEFVLGDQKKLGNSLVGEFRMGKEILEDFWIEFGILSIDSASGSGIEDQRLGSTGYLVGLSVGF